MGEKEAMKIFQIIKALIYKDRENLHTSLPGEIVEYDHNKRKAKVKPLIKFRKPDGTFLEYPIITGVPVVFPCSSTASFIFPVKKEDKVLLVFAERSIDEWLFDGRDMEPEIHRMHSISDCVAIPGLQPFTQTNPADEGNVEIHNGSQKIVIKQNGDIEIGGVSLSEVVKKSIISAFNTHTHTAPSGGGLTTTPTIPLIEIEHTTRTKVE